MPRFTTRTRTEITQNKTFDSTNTLGAVVHTASPTGDNVTQWATGSMTNTEFKALRATPKTLVAAPAAGKVLQFLGGMLFFDYTAAYTESTDNMAVKYTDGSGAAVSQTIESGGFVDATADTATCIQPKIDAIAAKTGCDAQALVLHNTGDGEFGGGNAANVIRFQVAYRVVAAGW